MDLLMLALLPMVLLIGIITSYQDIRYGKIKNKWIILGLIYFLVVYFSFIIFYIFRGGVNIPYLTVLTTNIFFSSLVGFGFWYFGIWAAGDGKLFIVLSALTPLSIYSLNFQKGFPAIDSLINIFILAFLFIFFNLLLNTKYKKIKESFFPSFKKTIEIKNLFFGLVNLFVISWLVRFFSSFVGINSALLNLSLIMAIFLLIPKRYEKNISYFFIPLAFFRFFLDSSMYSFDFLFNFLLLFLFLFFLRSLLENQLILIGKGVLGKEMRISQLKPGMVLGSVLLKKSKKELASLERKNSKVVKYGGNYYVLCGKSFLNFGDLLQEESEGVTKKQINLLKKLGFRTIFVKKTFPSAIFLFLGVLSTWIFKGNIFSFLRSFF